MKENRAVFFSKEKKEDRMSSKKNKVAEAKSQTCGEQRLAETGVAQGNLPDQSASSKRKTTDTGIND